MSTQPLCPARSERGVALIIVLLLLAVMSGLATGMAVNSQVEIAMASNENFYAGSRAAAEAGINRAIEAITNDTTTDLLAGPDGVVDAGNPGAAANDDNGNIGFMLTGGSPYALGATGEYTYTIQIFDDDDPSLYPTALTAAQLAAMNEDGSIYVNQNDRLILRATGIGPSGTVVTVARILETVDTTTTTDTTTITNPAILVDGDLTISGNPDILGANGSVHANGDLEINGNSLTVDQNATAAGTFDAPDGWHSGGSQGGGAPSVNVPTVNAADYLAYATHMLTSGGQVILVSTGLPVAGTGWTFSGGTWSLNGNDAPTGTFYAEGSVSVSGNRGSNASPLAMSIIATGSITVTGTSTLRPENAAALQFVTNGDLVLAGNLDADQTTVEGQSLVKEQVKISGNPDLRGQIIVADSASVFNEATSNVISGNPTITYDGSFGGLVTPGDIIVSTTYLNNVSGWMEGQ